MNQKYPICFSEEEFHLKLEELVDQSSSIYVVCDSNTLEHCWPKIASYSLLQNAEILEVPPGEESKSIEIAHQLWSVLHDMGADRKALIINLGGGMITDLGGFIASTFKRGIRFVHIPTSLLGMVDASIGGKTGINLNLSKNQIGTFSFPELLYINPKFLETLPTEELISGYAEMLKHGIIYDPAYLDRLIAIEPKNWNEVSDYIERSVRIKEEIVDLDPKESALRKILNFGHTVGHAIESLSHNSEDPIPHGQAVAIGMKVELSLSNIVLDLNLEGLQPFLDFLEKHYPLSKLNEFDPELIWKEMRNDKKNQSGKVFPVLIEQPGKAVSNQSITFDQLKSALKGA